MKYYVELDFGTWLKKFRSEHDSLYDARRKALIGYSQPGVSVSPITDENGTVYSLPLVAIVKDAYYPAQAYTTTGNPHALIELAKQEVEHRMLKFGSRAKLVTDYMHWRIYVEGDVGASPCKVFDIEITVAKEL